MIYLYDIPRYRWSSCIVRHPHMRCFSNILLTLKWLISIQWLSVANPGRRQGGSGLKKVGQTSLFTAMFSSSFWRTLRWDAQTCQCVLSVPCGLLLAGNAPKKQQSAARCSLWVKSRVSVSLCCTLYDMWSNKDDFFFFLPSAPSTFGMYL